MQSHIATVALLLVHPSIIRRPSCSWRLELWMRRDNLPYPGSSTKFQAGGLLSGSACRAAADGMECLELSWCSDRLLGIGTVIQTHEPVHVTGAVLEQACSAASLQTITVQELSVINFSSLTETAETKGCVSDAPPTGHYSRLFLPRATPWPQLYRSEF